MTIASKSEQVQLAQSQLENLDRPTHRFRRSRQLKFVVSYTLIVMMALGLTLQLALAIGAGRWLETGWVDLNAVGGLLVGAVQGLIQYGVLRSRFRVSVSWVGLTAITWAIVMSLDRSSLGWLSALVQGLDSPILFSIIISHLNIWADLKCPSGLEPGFLILQERDRV
jgi:hypothetical protein